MNATWVTVPLLAIAVTAGAETISKWRTPDGRLHLGDRPPPGSTLLETVELPDRPAPSVEEGSARDAAREQAAADGREIIRRRAETRRALREQAAERLAIAQEAAGREEPDTVIVLQRGFPYGMRDCFDPEYGFYRPKPVVPPPPPPAPRAPHAPKPLASAKSAFLAAR